MTGDDEWVHLDRLAAQQVDNPMLRAGGEDESAALDPRVNTNVVGGDRVEAADLGLRNIDRVAPLLISGTTRLGGGYGRLRELYQALIAQRHRELSAVAKLVGGVEETRYQAGRGEAPFAPVAAARQRAAVRFLVERGFAIPRPLLERELQLRLAQTGGMDALQGSNVQLLRQLIDPGVFQRMAEAQALHPKGEGYMGVDLLSDLTDGLFRELDTQKPVVELYRRELQRNYVTLLLVATGTVSDPQSASNAIESHYLDAGTLLSEARHLDSQRAAASPLAGLAQQFRRESGRPSEFRAALRASVTKLYNKIELAIKRSKDTATLVHLRDLRSDLTRI